MQHRPIRTWATRRVIRRGSGNSRNGTSAKTILTEDREIDFAVPRDRPAASSRS
jgi:transposase-like protein